MSASLFRRFAADRTGAFAVYAAVTVPVLLAALGFGLDYADSLSLRARFDAAADNAALAGVRTATEFKKSNASLYAASDLIARAKSAGDAAAVRAFNANASASLDVVPLTPKVQTEYNQTSNRFTATVSYSGVKTAGFGSMMGLETMPIVGSASAEVKGATYIKVYLLVDTSQSMGIAANPTEMAKLYDKVRCVFACHEDDGNNPEYDAAVANNIQLRIDVARKAIYNMASVAQASASGGNIQFKVHGMERQNTGPAFAPSPDWQPYPQPVAAGYLTDVWPPAGVAGNDYSNLMTAMSPPSRTLDISVVRVTQWATTQAGSNGYLHQPMPFPGDSDMTNSIAAFAAKLPANGDGSSPESPLNYVFVITDGLENVSGKIAPTCGAPWSPQVGYGVEWCENPMPASACDPLKAKNATVGVLYTTYLPLYAGNNPAKGYTYTYWPQSLEDQYGLDKESGLSAYRQVGFIPANLNACSSGKGWYYEASDDVGLLNGMDKLFRSALNPSRLTH